MVDLVPVRGEVEMRRVLVVVAASHKPVLLACSALTVISFVNSALSGSAACFEPGPVAVFALVAGQVGRRGLRPPARVVFKAGRVAGDALGVENRVGLRGRA